MPSAEPFRHRLLKKLAELFQLDKPDLDFGFYRIMHTKAREVQAFIDTDLLTIVADAFGDVDQETIAARADVYDHLYRFFERYYHDGDFISRRYATRETSARAAPFAVPYNGEEVKLHWANADQYYIKSSQTFSNFSFDLRQAKEVRAAAGGLKLEDPSPLKVHFRIVAAAEGEHGNLKTAQADKRFFILHEEHPIGLLETGELVVHFEYRPDPEKSGGERTWRAKRNAMAVERILECLPALAAANTKHSQRVAEYLRLFKVPAPTDRHKKRCVLARYVNQYTARNTVDYFIHKDLGCFLRRELDFYIKNEVMRLDDIESAEAPSVERYLAKIKVLRRVAGKLIDFLAQLEEFQKKLWLKKKFVIEVNYGITLDRVPEELYPDVAACEAQCDAWIKLFAIDQIQADAHGPAFSRPLTVAFLRANNKLVLETCYFDDRFKARLLASIDNFDAQCDGLLIHSENFQALHLLQERYRRQVKCTYIDPPYNTGGDGFTYKDSYQHSSWLSMFRDRMACFSSLSSNSGVFFASIDDNEMANMKHLLDHCFGPDQFESQIIIQSNKRGQTYQSIAKTHEYLFCYLTGADAEVFELPKTVASKTLRDDLGPYELWELRNRNPKFGRHNRPNLHYPIYVDTSRLNKEGYAKVSLTGSDRFSHEVWPKNSEGKDSCWRWGQEKVAAALAKHDRSILVSKQKRDGGWNIYEKARKGSTKAKSIWTETEMINEQGTVEVGSLGLTEFGFPKPTGLLKKVFQIGTQKGDLILDFFAGSGTTGHAVVRLNREDGGKRKYILVEMGDYFETVLKPRIAKAVYSQSWKGGKPGGRQTGMSHCFKTIRLESYEDTLNNLRMELNPPRQKMIAASPALREDYMLHYLLDVETRGSQSLLNIDAFADPTAYTLEVRKPGTDQVTTRAVDLMETFNLLMGLRVDHTWAPQTFQATFKVRQDLGPPGGRHTDLVVDGDIREDEEGPWWFRKVAGWAPKDSDNPNNGLREKVLIIWRKLTDDIERDNLVLNEWFQKQRIKSSDVEWDTIYVNGSNNLPNLRRGEETWEVRLIEAAFMKRMWQVEEA